MFALLKLILNCISSEQKLQLIPNFGLSFNTKKPYCDLAWNDELLSSPRINKSLADSQLKLHDSTGTIKCYSAATVHITFLAIIFYYTSRSK